MVWEGYNFRWLVFWLLSKASLIPWLIIQEYNISRWTCESLTPCSTLANPRFIVLTPYFYPIKKYGTWAHLHHGTKKWSRLFFKIPTCYIYENWWFSYWNLRFFELLLEHYRGGMNWLDQQTTLLHTFSPFGSFLECYLEMSCGKGWLSMSMVSSLLKYGICIWVQPRWKGNLDKFSNLQISLFIPFMKLYVQVLDGLLYVFFLLVIDLEVLYIYMQLS